MRGPYFTKKGEPPTEATVLAAIGRAGGAWRVLFDRLGAEHPDLSGAWAWYADGKSWLYKMSRKSKTVFWLSVERGAFRVTFYFPERLRDALLASGISDERKQEIRDSAPSGRLRRVSMNFGPQRGIRDVMTLIELKKTLR